MPKALVVLSLSVLFLLSGCMSTEEKARVHQASSIAREASKRFDAEKTKPAEVKEFLDNNAAAWHAFDKAVNRKKADRAN